MKQVYTKFCERGVINAELEVGFEEHPLTSRSLLPVEEEELKSDRGEDQTVTNDEIKHTELILEFSDDTRQQLLNVIPSTFKLLWDGNLSPLTPTDSTHSTLTNKLFVESLLELRVST